MNSGTIAELPVRAPKKSPEKPELKQHTYPINTPAHQPEIVSAAEKPQKVVNQPETGDRWARIRMKYPSAMRSHERHPRG